MAGKTGSKRELTAKVKSEFIQLYQLCASASIKDDMSVEMMKKYRDLTKDIISNIDSTIATIEVTC